MELYARALRACAPWMEPIGLTDSNSFCTYEVIRVDRNHTDHYDPIYLRSGAHHRVHLRDAEWYR